ncbi:Cof subfamily protein (haloacid dehalogenase superfamily) [Lactobacillus colini]|uniref:Cof subfamily protein (Haloacid dehalogenase superfamily) n=1 Tax=Lactobacillus colini TaxID=1819254 RepID=A0ABS4MDD2_9LACO|nr:Cof-type HAD-IIB family hydrolase [Lactobacillus colini]MBP2057696.1 Cof subfamily protein (haloacid dehalogenase superfamily) [Lactobacillus colini]
MIKLIASDMDGTLLNAQMKISPENVAAIKYAQKKGVEFLVATGRAQKESRQILEDVGLHTGYINLNGAMVFDTDGKLMVNEPIDRGRALKIIEILKDSGCYFEIVSADDVYSDSRMRRISNVSDLLVDLNKHLTFKKAVSFAGGSDEVLKISFVKDFKSLFDDPNFEVMKFVAFNPAGPSAFREIRRQINSLGNLVATASSSTNLEINNIKAQKGIALIDYAKMRNIDSNEVMAIGDNLNDESMIRMAGVGVAMENAISPIKELASFITKNNNDNGVAHAIRHFIK